MAVPVTTSPASSNAAASHAKAGAIPSSPATGGAAAPKPKSKKMLLLIPVLGLVLGGVALGAFSLLRGRSEHAEVPKKDQALDEAKRAKIVTLNPIVVNLRDTRGTRYLKVSIGLETDSDEVVAEIKTIGPQLSDFIVDRLSSVRMEEIDNSEGRNKLKRELLAGSNDLLRSGVIKQLYFSEFVIQ